MLTMAFSHTLSKTHNYFVKGFFLNTFFMCLRLEVNTKCMLSSIIFLFGLHLIVILSVTVLMLQTGFKQLQNFFRVVGRAIPRPPGILQHFKSSLLSLPEIKFWMRHYFRLMTTQRTEQSYITNLRQKK